MNRPDANESDRNGIGCQIGQLSARVSGPLGQSATRLVGFSTKHPSGDYGTVTRRGNATRLVGSVRDSPGKGQQLNCEEGALARMFPQ